MSLRRQQSRQALCLTLRGSQCLSHASQTQQASRHRPQTTIHAGGALLFQGPGTNTTTSIRSTQVPGRSVRALGIVQSHGSKDPQAFATLSHHVVGTRRKTRRRERRRRKMSRMETCICLCPLPPIPRPSPPRMQRLLVGISLGRANSPPRALILTITPTTPQTRTRKTELALLRVRQAGLPARNRFGLSSSRMAMFLW